MNYNLTNLNVFVLKTVSKHPPLKEAAQKFRYFLMRGPFQKHFVRYYQKHSKTKPPDVPQESLFTPIDAAKTVAEIESQSYSVSLQLPPEIVGEILAFRAGENSDNIFHPHRKCPLIKRVALDPQIIAVVRGYLHAEPIFYGSRLYNTPPRIDARGETTAKYKAAKIVHFDVTDFMDVSVFFYLSGVDLDSSPHIVAPGTHKRKSFRDLLAGRYNEAEARTRFENFVPVTGKAGLGFFEDSSCFHIQSLGRKGRMMLSFCYTLQRKAELALN